MISGTPGVQVPSPATVERKGDGAGRAGSPRLLAKCHTGTGDDYASLG